MTNARRFSGSSFVVATNGFGDGPAQALRDYLIRRDAMQVTVIQHPLAREDAAVHLITTYAGGQETVRRVRAPNRPPLTYGLDLLVPLLPPRATAWFGFTNLGALRGLVHRRLGLVRQVYYWAVDFVPDRFGPGPATWAYDRVDRYVSLRADARIELSDVAAAGRAARLDLRSGSAAPVVLVPMGAWLDRVPVVSSEAWRRGRIVFLGHLVERQGVADLIEAMPRIVRAHPEATLEIIGKGPEEAELKGRTTQLGLDDRVSFRGFVEEHSVVEELLAGSTIAAAPYVDTPDNFTRFADPGKLKAYLAAGLPIVVTPVPPNARELEAAGAAMVSQGGPDALAEAFGRFLGDEALWGAAHRSALAHAKRFDWGEILDEAFSRLGWA